MTAAAKRTVPFVTFVLIAANVAVFIFMITVGKADVMSPATGTLEKMGGNVPSWTKGGDWWRLVTAMFLHAGLFHLIMNMYSLWAFGRYLEAAVKPARYLVIYFVAGIVGSLASTFLRSGDSVGVGASGAVFGIFGGVLVYLLVKKSEFDPDVWKKQLLELGLLVAVNLIFGFTRSNIDNAAHLGGLVGGAAATFLLVRGMRGPVVTGG